jgi:hypothetical protein
MNRWRSRLAELLDASSSPANLVQNVRNVQNPSSSPTSEHFEQSEQGTEPAPTPANVWSDVEEERAAIAEYDGGAPRSWAEALARLDPMRPPADVSPKGWLCFIDDCGRFLDSAWATHAAKLNWHPLDLFGCDRERPFARVDRAGLLWLLNGRKLLALTADTAAIATPSGGSLTFYRRPVEPGRVVLAWELKQ